jgi:hypothetical protein
MSKSKITTPDAGPAGEPVALTDKELDAVTGGAVDLKGASEAMTQRMVQSPPAQTFLKVSK